MKSAAVEGLVHAIKLFDPAKGFKFSTYAHWWVRQAVNKILAVESRIVYVPQNVYELSIQAITIASQLKSEYHPAPVPDEAVAEKMGVTLKRLRDIKSAVKDPVSMNQTVNSSSEAEVGEMVSVRCSFSPALLPIIDIPVVCMLPFKAQSVRSSPCGVISI